MSKGKMIGIFALGFAIGGVVGAVCGYFYGEDKFKKEKDEEVEAERKRFEKILDAFEDDSPAKKKKEKKAEKAPEKKEDDVVTVGGGVPEGKTVDTHATDYSKMSSRVKDIQERVEIEAAPSEDDDEEAQIFEISGTRYGENPYFDTVEMYFYTESEDMKVSSWGSILDRYSDTPDDKFIETEDLLIHDVLPYLMDHGFLKKPFDVTHIRDNNLSIDVKVTKVHRKLVESENY